MNEIQRKLFNYILSAVQGHGISLADFKIVSEKFIEMMEKEAILNTLEEHIRPLDDMD